MPPLAAPAARRAPRVRRALLAPLVVAVALLALAAPAVAQATTAPPTSAPYDQALCVNALPRPECGTKPEASGDRGGAAQLALFGIMTAGMLFIAAVIVRSTLRTNRARREAAAAGASATKA